MPNRDRAAESSRFKRQRLKRRAVIVASDYPSLSEDIHDRHCRRRRSHRRGRRRRLIAADAAKRFARRRHRPSLTKALAYESVSLETLESPTPEASSLFYYFGEEPSPEKNIGSTREGDYLSDGIDVLAAESTEDPCHSSTVKRDSISDPLSHNFSPFHPRLHTSLFSSPADMIERPDDDSKTVAKNSRRSRHSARSSVIAASSANSSRFCSPGHVVIGLSSSAGATLLLALIFAASFLQESAASDAASGLSMSATRRLESRPPRVFSNQVVVELKPHCTRRDAEAVAHKHSLILIREVIPNTNIWLYKCRRLTKRSTRPIQKRYMRRIRHEPKIIWYEQQEIKIRKKRDLKYNDNRWVEMWYLNRGNGLDMAVEEAWRLNYTGKGVVVSILDDGIEKDHPDLQRNYDPQASYDVNAQDFDPQPRYDFTNENRHGTRCAGEVAAVADNNICIVGVAYDASIGGVRMLDGDVTDAVEAQSLSLNPQHIDIYSASWGPDDDGRTVDGPAKLAEKAFQDGVNMGRGGKGSIFVWASGNGGRDKDSCNCDGYTNSIYTLSISSATQSGNIPWYSEACSSTLASTYSSGSPREKQIVTTDLNKGCTNSHTGTSASAPLAAGICALALQANRNLTWRDLQHIVILSARPENLVTDEWVTNGVNRKVSHWFGYGLMDAAAMAVLAANWTLVPPQHVCKITSSDRNRNIPANGKQTFDLNVDGCRHSRSHRQHVKYLEHVQARITLSAMRRGELEIFLISPHGTRSCLLARRPRDLSRDGFVDWPFMSTHTWGETSYGKWKLEIRNWGTTSFFFPGSNPDSELKSWSLILYGTDVAPYSYRIPPSSGSGPRSGGATLASTLALTGLGLPGAAALFSSCLNIFVTTSDRLLTSLYNNVHSYVRIPRSYLDRNPDDRLLRLESPGNLIPILSPQFMLAPESKSELIKARKKLCVVYEHLPILSDRLMPLFSCDKQVERRRRRKRSSKARPCKRQKSLLADRPKKVAGFAVKKIRWKKYWRWAASTLDHLFSAVLLCVFVGIVARVDLVWG